jgi:hypothetical protein
MLCTATPVPGTGRPYSWSWCTALRGGSHGTGAARARNHTLVISAQALATTVGTAQEQHTRARGGDRGACMPRGAHTRKQRLLHAACPSSSTQVPRTEQAPPGVDAVGVWLARVVAAHAAVRRAGGKHAAAQGQDAVDAAVAGAEAAHRLLLQVRQPRLHRRACARAWCVCVCVCGHGVMSGAKAVAGQVHGLGNDAAAKTGACLCGTPQQPCACMTPPTPPPPHTHTGRTARTSSAGPAETSISLAPCVNCRHLMCCV